jgi:hypothetical protein
MGWLSKNVLQWRPPNKRNPVRYEDHQKREKHFFLLLAWMSFPPDQFLQPKKKTHIHLHPALRERCLNCHISEYGRKQNNFDRRENIGMRVTVGQLWRTLKQQC